MATVKNVNYTEAQTADLVAKYQAGETVENLAKFFGKTTRSIVAKLSREKVYTAKEYKTKTGEPVQAKLEIADKICAFANLPATDAESLAKANKQALIGILAEFTLLNSKLKALE